ncbi:rod shape-determining protein MreD [Phocaeicola faecicola]|jgi:rod shape-determining protein MreD|uniref:rod shape-determining protein MreD n=1 Tax=Phocaeicola faecicola TaxID=2739389 RepID=UPI0015B41BC7|nr:rod shape-determining protein MreD [Phocaeicola faecicola]MDY4871501.1 rod shape-determining protein MreD [Phocaeicola faecicola]
MIQLVYRSAWFVFFLLLQVLVLNRMHISGYATPVLYVYFILMQRTETSRKQLMLQAFFLGLCVDIFSNTPGMNAAASTFLAFVRNGLLRMQTLRGMTEDYAPGMRTMGTSPFLRYVISCVFIHITLLHLIDAFSLWQMKNLLWKILSDVCVTVICVVCVDMARRKR